MKIGTPPWRVEDDQMGIVVDTYGRVVAVVPHGFPRLTVDSNHKIGCPTGFSNLDPDMSVEEHCANLNLIACAPELLEALKEAAYHLDVAGIPLNQKFYDLINRASPTMAPLLPFSKTVDKNKT